MKEIKIVSKTHGCFQILVDDEDFGLVSPYKWCISKRGNTFYAYRGIKLSNGKWTTQQMHRFLMDVADSKIEVDHIDGNGLNNQKYNLRLAAHQQNMQNRKVHKNNTSGFKGVSWNKSKQKWVAHISINGKLTYLGRYLTPEEASLVYESKARELFGEFYKENKYDSVRS